MAIETFANNYQTTLAAGINNSTTTVTVNDAPAGNLAASGVRWRLQVATEIMVVTAVSGATLTVLRGQEGSAAASHSSGDAAVHNVTGASLLQLRADAATTGADASRPAQSSLGAGRIYLPSDDVVLSLDDGSVYRTFGPVYRFVAPDDSQFSWHNQGGSTTTQYKGSVLLNVGVSASANLRGRIKSLPGSTYDVKAAFANYANSLSNCIMGMWLLESGSGKIVTFTNGWSSGSWQYQVVKWANATSFSGVYTLQSGGSGIPSPMNGVVNWMRIVDDGTNRKMYYSHDGTVWFLLHTISKTDFCTPDNIGFFIDQENTTFEGVMRLLSWEQ